MEFLKKSASASKRAMAELLSNGTDNNKDARGRNALGNDKREELKKELFQSFAAEAGEDSVIAQDKANITEQSTRTSGDTVRAAFENTSFAKEKSRTMSEGACSESRARVASEGPCFAQNTARVSTEAARPAKNPSRISAEGTHEQGTAKASEGVRTIRKITLSDSSTGIRTVQDIARSNENARFADERKGSSESTLDSQRKSNAALSANGASPVQPQKKKNSSDKKKKNRIASVVLSFVALLLTAAICVGIYLYRNQEEEFIPADLVAGNTVPSTVGYVKLVHDESAVSPTEDRYSIKFTFYEAPEIVCSTKETTVGELMGKLGITVGENNRCSMTAESVLSADSTVDIQTITYETVSKEEAVPYDTKYIDIRTIPKGTTKLSENGKNGVKTYTYKCTLVNGVEESRELISEKITTNPKSKVMYRGVGGTITSQGKTYNYSYYIDVKATVYNIVGTTASGLPTGTNVMAVDPRVIPLGTKCVVTGGSGDYGYRIAADTGGNIKGNKIDLWYPAGTFNGFGWRSTRVYILE